MTMFDFPTGWIDRMPTFAASHNATLLARITPTTFNPPWYYIARERIHPAVSDTALSLAAPIIVYWIVSSVFHFLDVMEFSYFEKRRIHESAETKARNRASLSQVLWAVIFQQVVQTITGFIVLESEKDVLRTEYYKDHMGSLRWLAPRVADVTFALLGQGAGRRVLEAAGPRLTEWVYWWGVPALQLFLGCCVIDTWQYWLHRTMHTYPVLYRHFHSHHHRLYVPFAFGALYNHPVEGLLLDTLGAGIAQFATFMTIRQATLLFTISSWKTVDDHCGYRLWWDPCQMFFANNADYHDIHHQTYGIKANFAQPFFTNWDYFLGTQMTRAQAEKRHAPVPKGTIANGAPSTSVATGKVNGESKKTQ